MQLLLRLWSWQWQKVCLFFLNYDCVFSPCRILEAAPALILSSQQEPSACASHASLQAQPQAEAAPPVYPLNRCNSCHGRSATAAPFSQVRGWTAGQHDGCAKPAEEPSRAARWRKPECGKMVYARSPNMWLLCEVVRFGEAHSLAKLQLCGR